MRFNQSSKTKTGRKRKVKLTLEVDALLRNCELTDQQVADRLNVSRHTVLRMRKRARIQKPAGGARAGAGRPPADVVPQPRPGRRLARVSDEEFARWCESVYVRETRRGRVLFVPRWEGRRVNDLPIFTPGFVRGQKGV